MKIDVVFTTGAYLTPELVDGKWRWVVSGFEDDTFYDGNLINTVVSSDTKEGLIMDG